MFNAGATIEHLTTALAELDSSYLAKVKTILDDADMITIDKAITLETYTMTYRKIRGGMIEATDILKRDNPF